jgi:hypothetical protein
MCYYSNWKQIIKRLPVNKVFFKLSLTGGYVLKMMDDEGFVISPAPGEFGFDIPEGYLDDCIEWLHKNHYVFHEHSIIK